MSTPILHLESIAKTFAGVKALRDVSFQLFAGEVHALVGENGAGKSTLTRVITGEISPDAGRLSIYGQPVKEHSIRLACSLGIAAVYQQPSLFPHLSVAENIALTLEQSEPAPFVNWKRRRARAVEVLGRLGAAIDPDRLAASLSMAEQQIVEIAKAIGAKTRMLLMDEPTALLTDREVRNLFSLIRRVRAEGVGVVYISHRLEEIQEIADRITVLRDGESIGTRNACEVSRPE